MTDRSTMDSAVATVGQSFVVQLSMSYLLPRAPPLSFRIMLFPQTEQNTSPAKGLRAGTAVCLRVLSWDFLARCAASQVSTGTMAGCLPSDMIGAALFSRLTVSWPSTMRVTLTRSFQRTLPI